MASYITTNTDLTTYYPVIASEVERLTTPEMEADTGIIAWQALHTSAWRAILRDLGRRRPAIIESDLSDTSQFKEAALYYVLHLAYLNADMATGAKHSADWLRRYEAEMAAIEVEVSGTASAPQSFGVRLVRG